MDPEHVLRIDKPAFDHAITLGPRILIVICLESTSAPSEALLADCAQTAGVEVTPNTLICAAAWPCFETGDMDAFNTTIAHNVRNACNTETYDSVILAQASMAGAARLLRDLNAPVLTTPHMAVQAAIAAAKTRA
jgi:Asp/Glu/hydantoin racemase